VLAERVVTDVVEIYASKEVRLVAVIGRDRIATPVPGVGVRVVDAVGTVLGQGEIGLIEVRSDRVAGGYVAASAAEGAAFHDGWYRSADLGRMLPDGRFQFLDRADDMLVVGGRKSSPVPYEERLRALPGVTEAVLLAVPGHDGPDRVRVVLETSAPPATEAVVALMSAEFTHFDVVTVNVMPRTVTGKVRRTELRAMTD
jgi:acyl-CoA synthetase (AMP-forming)/AMP-acid ligase II